LEDIAVHPDPMGPAQQRLNDYVARIGEIQRQAEQTQEQIRSLRATASSQDDAVTVILAPGGRLERLTLTPKAMELGHERLASVIGDTIRAAHDDAAAQTQSALQPLVGDSQAMDFLRDQVVSARADDPSAPRAEEEPRQRAGDHDDNDHDDDHPDDDGGLDGPFLQR
jgi:DNA-binding protein YbaB